MPSPNDKQLTLAYAAGASLAAVTLVYVFGPTWFIDSSKSSSRQRKTGVVGLVNTANDCFVRALRFRQPIKDSVRNFALLTPGKIR